MSYGLKSFAHDITIFHFTTKDRKYEAARMFEYSLADCANYRPSVAVLAGCYEALDETEKLAELKKQWDSDQDEAAKESQSTIRSITGSTSRPLLVLPRLKRRERA